LALTATQFEWLAALCDEVDGRNIDTEGVIPDTRLNLAG
jgi:hypothetical protein